MGNLDRDRLPFCWVFQYILIWLAELKRSDVVIVQGEIIRHAPIAEREIISTSFPHRRWGTEYQQGVALRTKSGALSGLPHRENRSEENHVLSMHNPFGAGRIQCVRE
jgi:hypothetical protein